jgi:nucleoside-diphosphate-sugar epimerase
VARILVTGANGFLGAKVVERLLLNGEQVRCLVRAGSDLTRLESVRQQHLDGRRGPDNAGESEIVVGSLSTIESAASLLDGVEVVVHLAAALRGTAADMFLNTVVTTDKLLQAVFARTPAPRVVLVSSFGVYGTADLPANSVVDETTPLEPHPERRDHYSYAKLRQETLAWEYQRLHGFPLVVLRPGVIYGPGGGGLSARIGLQLPGVFLNLGGKNLLPLSFVDNCADAVMLAATDARTDGQVLNVHDDELPTSREFFAAYQRIVGKKFALTVPFPLLQLGSYLCDRYHRASRGQLPAIFTPYKTLTTWKGTRFSNAKLKSLGWKQRIPTAQAMQLTFDALANRQATKSG